MRKPMQLLAGALLILATLSPASAQMLLPDAKTPTGEELFKRQCSTCHTTNPSDAQRQGPTLAGVFGRKAGTLTGFHYSSGFAKADWAWDDAHLQSWLTNPQAVIPGAIMLYKQPKPDVRATIISYLKDLH